MCMTSLLKNCNSLYNKLPPCDGNNEDFSCDDCCKQDYWDRSDTYSCLKKLCHYTLNYGPAYASEIYHYFEISQILENYFLGKNIKVLSLGCGFSPDAYALEKYIKDNNLNIKFNYIGYDAENKWEEIREQKEVRHYETRNLLSGFCLKNYDIIFMCKVFSTIKRNNNQNAINFLKILTKEIDNMKENSYFIFNDVNYKNFGRDLFDNSVKWHFSNVTRYYFPVNNAFTGDYKSIDNINNVFDFPSDLEITPKTFVNKSIIFEYRK